MPDPISRAEIEEARKALEVFAAYKLLFDPATPPLLTIEELTQLLADVGMPMNSQTISRHAADGNIPGAARGGGAVGWRVPIEGVWVFVYRLTRRGASGGTSGRVVG